MLDSLTQLQQPPQPTNDLQYMVIAIIFAIIAITLGWRFLDLKFGPKAPAPDPMQSLRQGAYREADIQGIKELISVQFNGLKENLSIQLGSVEKRVDSRLEDFKQLLDANEEREEARLREITQQMADGFRLVHGRLDKHINGHTSQEEIGRELGRSA